MTTQHTPTPWAFDQEADNSTDFWVFQSNGPARVAVECSEADAAFIVRACNAHDELVAALYDAMPALVALELEERRRNKRVGSALSKFVAHDRAQKVRAALAKVSK